jgi:hypothetical protein
VESVDGRPPGGVAGPSVVELVGGVVLHRRSGLHVGAGFLAQRTSGDDRRAGCGTRVVEERAA